MSYEQPDYEVLYKDGKVEYRQYQPYLVSETVIDNYDDYKDAGNEGFRRLFRYISGNNRSQSKISMTVPVQQAPSEKIAMTVPVQQSEEADGWRVSFVLPPEYTLETAPVPNDPRVYTCEVPGRLMAVIEFSGRWHRDNFEKKEDALREVLDAAGVSALGEPQTAVYNAPFSLPFLRRNEVMVQVDGLPVEATADAERRLAAF